MSINNFRPHIVVLPEDRANEIIATEFSNSLKAERTIKIEKPARGWNKAVEKLLSDNFINKLKQYNQRIVVLIIDCDGDKDRLANVMAQIPMELRNRIFVLGVLTEPEKLRRDTRRGFDEIGEALAQECSNNNYELWEHPLLQHNEEERQRLRTTIHSFLFGL